jgi:hypothetical protein
MFVIVGSKMRTCEPKSGAGPGGVDPPPHIGVVVQLGGQLFPGGGGAPPSDGPVPLLLLLLLPPLPLEPLLLLPLPLLLVPLEDDPEPLLDEEEAPPELVPEPPSAPPQGDELPLSEEHADANASAAARDIRMEIVEFMAAPNSGGSKAPCVFASPTDFSRRKRAPHRMASKNFAWVPIVSRVSPAFMRTDKFQRGGPQRDSYVVRLGSRRPWRAGHTPSATQSS